jgi:quercetin dioxygenase-like cupin family protein
MINRRGLIQGVTALGALGAVAACASSVVRPVVTATSTSSDPSPTAGVTRTQLQRLPSPNPGWDIVQTRVEIPVGKESGLHTHPGPEVGYIVQGDVSMEFEDRPAQMLHIGDPFLIPAGVKHNARNVGTVRTMMLSTYVIDATQPLVHNY